MNTKRWLALAVTSALAVSLMALPALAETSAGPQPEAQAPTGTDRLAALADSTLDEGWLTTVEPLVAQFQALRDESAALQQQARDAGVANRDSLKSVRSGFNMERFQEAKALREQLQQSTETVLKPLYEQARSLQEQMKSARESQDLAASLRLRVQLANVNRQIKAETEALAPQRDAWKALNESFAGVRAVNESLKATVKPLLEQEKALHLQNRDLGPQIRQAWQSFQSSLKAGDGAGIEEALNALIGVKEQEVANLKQILSLQEQVAAALAEAAE